MNNTKVTRGQKISENHLIKYGIFGKLFESYTGLSLQEPSVRNYIQPNTRMFCSC